MRRVKSISHGNGPQLLLDYSEGEVIRVVDAAAGAREDIRLVVAHNVGVPVTQ